MKWKIRKKRRSMNSQVSSLGEKKKQNQQTFIQTDQERNKTQITKIRNEGADITSNLGEIKGIIRGYYEQLYANRLANLDEVDKFPKIHSTPGLNHGEMENWNTLKASKEIRLIQKTCEKENCKARELHW